MSKTIIANWKMNPQTLEEALNLFDFSVTEAAKHSNLQVVICPPFVFLEELAKNLRTHDLTHLRTISLGAQDLFWEHSGPYTGEVSADMLKEFGVSHVLVGHSDRRYKLGETDQTINKKIKAALEAGITPVLLVGEQNRGDDRQAVLEQQLSADLAGLTPEQISRTLITYEPVWAISTQPDATADTPENALEAIEVIRKFLGFRFQISGFRFLYGGSVNENNVADFLSHPEISGAVIGGASLRKEEFSAILKIVSALDPLLVL